MSDTGFHSTARNPRPPHGGGSWLSELTIRGRVVVISLAVVVTVSFLIAGVDALASAGRIHPGVRVGDVQVGSLTVVDARARIRAESAKRLARPVTARSGSRTWTVTSEAVGAKVDVIGSVERADRVGRTGGLGRMIAERAAAIFGGVSVAAKVDGEPELTASVLARIEQAVAVPARDASVVVDGVSVRLVGSRPGLRVRTARAQADILAAFFTDSRSATILTEPAPVSVSDADAAAALRDAGRLVAGPVSVLYKGAMHNVAREGVAAWVAFGVRPVDPRTGQPLPSDAGTGPAQASGSAAPTLSAAPAGRSVLVAYFDAAKIGGTIAPFTKGVGRPAIDAKFVAAKGRVSIKPSQVGLGPDLGSLASDLAHACITGQPRRAELKLAQTQPRLTTEQAKAMRISDRISAFTTTFNPGNLPRTNNIRLLSGALDNKLVAPGATFSFNAAAGERTARKGYQEAPAIVNGKLVPQLGGGVCQVGTTFFNTVFLSGLPIIERRNHSFYISHYPKGRDCTVSWGGPDFKWKNDTANWILIRTQISGGSLTISLYGTDPGYQVDFTTGGFTNVRPYTVTEMKDPTLTKGAKVIEDPGADGSTVTVVRTVLKAGKVVRTDTFVSHYNPKEEVVRVGTKVPSKPATGTPVP